jgi:hypothetical protein
MMAADPRAPSEHAHKISLLQEEVTIKEKQLRDCKDDLYKKEVVLGDLEEQLKRAAGATVVRELNHQLRQMVLVHRQLLRKVCFRCFVLLVGVQKLLVFGYCDNSMCEQDRRCRKHGT